MGKVIYIAERAGKGCDCPGAISGHRATAGSAAGNPLEGSFDKQHDLMGSESWPEDKQARGLLMRIKTAQGEGKACYLIIRGTDSKAIEVPPSGDPEEAVRLADELGLSLEGYVRFSKKKPSCTIIFNSEEEMKERNLREFIEGYPLETIGSLLDLDLAIIASFGYKEIEAYRRYLEALPPEPGDKALSVVLELLEAGELPGVPILAEEYLRGAGLHDDEIALLFDINERERRASARDFEDRYGTSPSDIKTAAQFNEAIGGKGNEADAVFGYIIALPNRVPREIIRDVVIPLIESGINGAKD